MACATAQKMELNFITPEDYDMISLIDFNREVDRAHVDELKESIKEFGLLMPALLREREGKFEVIDLQHRVVGAMELGLEIPYVLANHLTLEQLPHAIARLNSTSKKWTLLDYFQLYKKMDVPAYVELQKFMDKSHLSLRCSLYLWTAYNPLSAIINASNDWRPFTKGRFQKNKSSLDNITQVMNNFYRLKNIVGEDESTKNSAFSDSLLKVILHPDYDHQRMVANLERHPDDFEHFFTQDQNFDAITFVYNRTKAGSLSFDYQIALDGTVCFSENEAYKIRRQYVNLEEYAEMVGFVHSYVRGSLKKQPNKGVPDFVKGRRKYWKLSTATKWATKVINARG